MYEDEEVVFMESELHKYMKSNCGAVDFQDMYEFVNNEVNNTDGDFTCDSKLNNVTLIPSEKCTLPEDYSNIVWVILKSGLLYPDHIIDLENYLVIPSTDKLNTIKNVAVIYSSCLIASSALTVWKRYTLLNYFGFAAAAFCSYKLYAINKIHSDISKIKRFITSVEDLFAINKKSLSFILENEFILRSKIIRDQQAYIPSNGWVNLNTTEGMKYSGLLVAEFRNLLVFVYLDTITVFNNFLMCMPGNLFTVPASDDTIKLPEEFNTFHQETGFPPSSEDLKKLNTLYLLMQSECLKRIILSFVEGMWKKKESQKIISSEMIQCMDCSSKHTKRLKVMYQKCINEVKRRSLCTKIYSTRQIGNPNSKLYIFVKGFLTKADAHVLSLFSDLKMVNEWVDEFEENNKDNSDVNENLIIMLQEKLQQLKINLECFTNLYNDNCNLLRGMSIKGTNESSNHLLDVVEKLNEAVTVTGIEVGKSDFQCSGKDEVLISLSNIEDNKLIKETGIIDYEEELVKQTLPKNVLNELKFVLKDKKEEWIEREKKATSNQDVSLDCLDFDNLTSTNDCEESTLSKTDFSGSKYNNLSNNFEEIIPLNSNKSKSDNNVIERFNDQPNTSMVDESIYFSFTTNLDNSEAGNASVSRDSPTIDSVLPVRSGNFVDQIKLAQRSFNLNNIEEEFLGDYSEDEECND